MPEDTLIIQPNYSDKQKVEDALKAVADALASKGMLLQHGPDGMILAEINSRELKLGRAMAVVRKVVPLLYAGTHAVEYALVDWNTDPGKVEVTKQ